MKNIFKNILFFSTILFVGITFNSCTEDELELDADKVIPKIFTLNGPTVGFQNEVKEYSVTPTRGGSEYIWTVTGAVVQPIAGRTDKINVLFNQFAQPVTVSVVEKAANGKVSEAVLRTVTVLGTPCNWTINMQDLYGDGWNGASVEFKIGSTVLANCTITNGASGTQTVPVPNGSVVTITFNSGEWDEEVVFQIYDASGALVLEDGPTPTVGQIYSGTNVCP